MKVFISISGDIYLYIIYIYIWGYLDVVDSVLYSVFTLITKMARQMLQVEASVSAGGWHTSPTSRR